MKWRRLTVRLVAYLILTTVCPFVEIVCKAHSHTYIVRTFFLLEKVYLLTLQNTALTAWLFLVKCLTRSRYYDEKVYIVEFCLNEASILWRVALLSVLNSQILVLWFLWVVSSEQNHKILSESSHKSFKSHTSARIKSQGLFLNSIIKLLFTSKLSFDPLITSSQVRLTTCLLPIKKCSPHSTCFLSLSCGDSSLHFFFMCFSFHKNKTIFYATYLYR